MPRNVRNFWGSIESEGRTVETGPSRKDEGIDITIYQRNAGEVTRAITARGWVEDDGTLVLTVYGPDGIRIFQHRTTR